MNEESIPRASMPPAVVEDVITEQEGRQLEEWWIEQCRILNIDPYVNPTLLFGPAPLFDPESDRARLLRRYLGWRAVKRTTDVRRKLQEEAVTHYRWPNVSSG